jgi:hypothetical protein
VDHPSGGMHSDGAVGNVALSLRVEKMNTEVYWDEKGDTWMVRIIVGGPLNYEGAALAVVIDGAGETMTLEQFMQTPACQFALSVYHDKLMEEIHDVAEASLNKIIPD